MKTLLNCSNNTLDYSADDIEISTSIKPIFTAQTHRKIFNIWELLFNWEDYLGPNNMSLDLQMIKIYSILCYINLEYFNLYPEQISDLTMSFELYVKLAKHADKKLFGQYFSFINENIINVIKCQKKTIYVSKMNSQTVNKIQNKISQKMLLNKICSIFKI